MMPERTLGKLDPVNLLDQIVAAAKDRVARDKNAGCPGKLGAPPPGLAPPRLAPPRFAPPRRPFVFENSLRRPDIAFICEVKKASPSKGIIADPFPYLEIAKAYEEAGAAAISVLTEPDFFMGADRYLSEIRSIVDLPLLRKDFTIDPFQIEQAARLGADAVLLIAAILSEPQMAEYIRTADALGLSCLVEAHDEAELAMALRAGARVVGVNNRNLKTFEVDTANSARLRKLAPPEVIFVSESGIRTAADISLLRRHGVDAALVGETLMRAPDKKKALAELRGD